jgi:hypothetical protein
LEDFNLGDVKKREISFSQDNRTFDVNFNNKIISVLVREGKSETQQDFSSWKEFFNKFNIKVEDVTPYETFTLPQGTTYEQLKEK